MPINARPPTEWAEPTALSYVDRLPRPVVAFAGSARTPRWDLTPHEHRRAQLLYTVRGMINCQVADGVWIVPPGCAVWIPGGLAHAACGSGETECYCLFVTPHAVAADLPARCCTFSVSPLLHELLRAAARLPDLYAVDGPEGRLIATLLDQIAGAPVEELWLPMPCDERLRRLAEMLLQAPADRSSLAEWARRIGMSERSLSRIFPQEMGMSFGRWRRQLHVILSLQRLGQGQSVHHVASDLGYEEASSFVKMFRKVVGKPPARYVSSHHAPLMSVRGWAPMSSIALRGRT